MNANVAAHTHANADADVNADVDARAAARDAFVSALLRDAACATGAALITLIFSLTFLQSTQYVG